MKKKSLVLVAILIIAFFCFTIFNNKQSTSLKKETPNQVVKKETKEETNTDEEDYTSDIVGTIYIPDTTFKATITQTADNIYYLNHDVDGNSVSKGNPFLDYRDSVSKSNALRIYGHNSRTIFTEFHVLEGYYKEQYYKEHPYIYFDTNKDSRKYQIFSSYIEAEDWSYYNANLDNPEVYKEELDKYKKKSAYDTGVEVTENDRILILQTCSYDSRYAKYKNKYLLIMAKEV